MTPRSDRNPLQPPSTRVRCPVCHEVVYSRAGIHPQCAVRRSDPPRPKVKPEDVVVEGEPAVATIEPVEAEPEVEVVVEVIAVEAPVVAAKASKPGGRRRP